MAVPHPGNTVTITLHGEPGGEGYNAVHTEKAGWRYGFVAVTKDGTSVYGQMKSDAVGTVSYTAPKDVSPEKLWLVVMGAPTEHWMNEEGGTDAQWPYSIKVD